VVVAGIAEQLGRALGDTNMTGCLGKHNGDMAQMASGVECREIRSSIYRSSVASATTSSVSR
jgi:hypothetical protein